MDNLIGYPLKDALIEIENIKNTIVNIKKIIGSNNKFNSVSSPYIVRCKKNDNYITLFVCYY